jgi:hypothetical protein
LASGNFEIHMARRRAAGKRLAKVGRRQSGKLGKEPGRQALAILQDEKTVLGCAVVHGAAIALFARYGNGVIRGRSGHEAIDAEDIGGNLHLSVEGAECSRLSFGSGEMQGVCCPDVDVVTTGDRRGTPEVLVRNNEQGKVISQVDIEDSFGAHALFAGNLARPPLERHRGMKLGYIPYAHRQPVRVQR